MLRFILGSVFGFMAGAAAAVIYSARSGHDLREEFERLRSEIQQRDFEALGSHLEERFKELQAMLEERQEQTEEASTEAADDNLAAIEVAADDTAEALEEVAEEATPA